MTPAVFGRGHLRLYLLALLDEQPRHGYELIQALTDRFGGTYVPSAGTIYPRLAKLEDDGLVTRTSDGRKSVYEITDAGREELHRRAGELEGIEGLVTDSVRHLADEVRRSVDDAMKSLRAELAASTREARATANADARSVKRDEDEARVASRVQLQLAEAALARFRAELRTELRQAVVHDRVTAATVDVLRSGLDQVMRSVRETLK
ncbi:PadR family transcriptional regulator [Herbiconiux sp. L3-i23]|uniref:PadR family transcriptional regulator n=1 Tax=Herbiconiux sp. L3-i23 TaxID=2905871 RepID=UPI0020661AD9|nr:PadR family transcriptional regulator [Herbiconiux sp. L3-i23]BDI24018.1 hypothetical protein L3i23_27940 [Herbiconiux sp. L3-i23]